MTLIIRYRYFVGITLAPLLLALPVRAQTAREADLAEYTYILLDNGILSAAGVAALTEQLTGDDYLIPTRGRPGFSLAVSPDSVFAVRVVAGLAGIYQQEFFTRSGMAAAIAFIVKRNREDSIELPEMEQKAMLDSMRNTRGFRTELALGVDPTDTTEVRGIGGWIAYPPFTPTGDVPLFVGENISI
ncbi:MAG: hypothetical protein AAFZ52_17560, partial [Bacteroidota bacterium]